MIIHVHVHVRSTHVQADIGLDIYAYASKKFRYAIWEKRQTFIYVKCKFCELRILCIATVGLVIIRINIIRSRPGGSWAPDIFYTKHEPFE